MNFRFPRIKFTIGDEPQTALINEVLKNLGEMESRFDRKLWALESGIDQKLGKVEASIARNHEAGEAATADPQDRLSNESLKKLGEIEILIEQKFAGLEAKIIRMWLSLDFIRTHSSSYLGNGLALTNLVDDMPIVVNSNDRGGPMNFINGGRYEEDNLDVLLSYVEPNTVFLDIGANLGFFSLKIGNHIRRGGRVFAFEPHPQLVPLIQRSAFLNGLDRVINVFNFGLSDTDRSVEFSYPRDHLGGGFVGPESDPGKFQAVVSSVKQLDNVFDGDFVADLMKIDVEGHELAALRGMRGIIARSPQLKIMFEKLGVDAGYELKIEELFSDLGFNLYGIHSAAVVSPIEQGELASFSGYVLACRPNQVGESNRRRFSIYPSQLTTPDIPTPQPGQPLVRTGNPGDNLFHGPYWYLRRGVWELRFHGSISEAIEITVAERFGYATQKLTIIGENPVVRFVNERDLIQFELIARPAHKPVVIELKSLELVRVG